MSSWIVTDATTFEMEFCGHTQTTAHAHVQPHGVWLKFEHTKNSNPSKNNFRNDKSRIRICYLIQKKTRNRSNWFRAAKYHASGCRLLENNGRSSSQRDSSPSGSYPSSTRRSACNLRVLLRNLPVLPFEIFHNVLHERDWSPKWSYQFRHRNRRLHRRPSLKALRAIVCQCWSTFSSLVCRNSLPSDGEIARRCSRGPVSVWIFGVQWPLCAYWIAHGYIKYWNYCRPLHHPPESMFSGSHVFLCPVWGHVGPCAGFLVPVITFLVDLQHLQLGRRQMSTQRLSRDWATGGRVHHDVWDMELRWWLTLPTVPCPML